MIIRIKFPNKKIAFATSAFTIKQKKLTLLECYLYILTTL